VLAAADISVPPPSHPTDVLGGEFVIGQRAAGINARGADEELVMSEHCRYQADA
jgi:hypothetical protein